MYDCHLCVYFLRKKKGFEVCRLKILHIEIVSTFLKLPIRFHNEEHLKKEQFEIPVLSYWIHSIDCKRKKQKFIIGHANKNKSNGGRGFISLYSKEPIIKLELKDRKSKEKRFKQFYLQLEFIAVFVVRIISMYILFCLWFFFPVVSSLFLPEGQFFASIVNSIKQLNTFC